MNLVLLLLLFISSCAVITICFTKKHMDIARAVFLGIGVTIGFCSALLIYAQHSLDVPYVNPQKAESLRLLVTYMLGIATIIYGLVLLYIAVATVILSLLALRKIAEYVKGKTLNLAAKSQIGLELPQEADLPRRKIFLLYCRLID